MADFVQDTYDSTGGGRFGPKTNVHTKEYVDHSLPYLLAIVLSHRVSPFLSIITGK
jgi:hypothetical protein